MSCGVFSLVAMCDGLKGRACKVALAVWLGHRGQLSCGLIGVESHGADVLGLYGRLSGAELAADLSAIEFP